MIQVDDTSDSTRFRAVTRANVQRLPQWAMMDDDLREAIMVVSAVLPFRTNEYVVNDLIDFERLNLGKISESR